MNNYLPPNNARLQSTEIPVKIHCIVGWKIITHLLLAYCVIGITYLLLTNNHCTCTDNHAGSVIEYTSYATTRTPSLTTTFKASKSPSNGPSTLPTHAPSEIPTDIPNHNPSFKPSLYPSSSPSMSYPTADISNNVNISVLREQMMEINVTAITLKQLVTELQVQFNSSITQVRNNLNESAQKINNLTKIVRELPSSMVERWPDAITCTGNVSGHTVYYLVHGPEGNSNLYYYRFENTNDQRNFVYNPDGSYNRKEASIGASNCDGKSITQLYAEGLAFNFVIKSVR